MKRTHLVSLVGAASVAGLLAVAQGCSSSSDAPSAVKTKRPPERPSAATADTSTKTFAVQTLYLGDALRNNPASVDAWKKFGYDLDGKVTTKESTDVCKLPPGQSQRTAKEDGDDGIDNSFGHNLLPIITGVSPTAVADLNGQLTKGTFTLMFTVTGLSDDPHQTANGLKGFMSAGGAFDPTGQKVPGFVPTDVWPVAPELLSNPSDATSSKVQFADSYVTDGTWVNGSDAKVTISLGFNGQSLDLTMYKAIVTFEHKDPTTAANGIIAGILNTDELIGGLTKIAGRLQKDLCSGDQLKLFTDQIRAVSDIMADGSQDPSKTCDGISIGLGFDAKQIANPSVVAPAADTGGDPCAPSVDGGADSASPVDAASPADAGSDAPVDAASD
jgi:hypothetical protein